jgi:DNA topoisomerase-1
MRVNEFLVGALDPLFNVKFTAEMEEKLDRIEDGSVEWTDMMQKFYTQFLEWLEGARDMADADETKAVLAALEQVKEWAEPVKRGRRTYDERETVQSVREKFAADGQITQRQYQMLFNLACKYMEQIGGEQVSGLKLEKPEAPREETVRKLEMLESITFSAARKVGKKTYDDKKFCESLRQQVQGGRRLSERQVAALDSVLTKYSDQIADFETIKESLNMAAKPETADAGQTGALLDLLKNIQTWNPPVMRGKREFNDQSFYESLSTQFAAKGALSEKQVAALKKIVSRYAAQIPDFDAIREQYGLPEPKVKK